MRTLVAVAVAMEALSNVPFFSGIDSDGSVLPGLGCPVNFTDLTGGR